MTNKKVSFWRVFWPSLTSGVVLIILFLVLFASLIGSMLNTKPIYTVQDKTILHLQLNGAISEMSKSDISFSNLGIVNEIGLADLLYGFEKAAKDEIGRASCRERV